MAAAAGRSGDDDSAGSTNVPVTSVAGFVVGEKIALGYGATYPVVARTIEKYEVATVTAIGKPGTQGRLAAAAQGRLEQYQGGNVDNISVGDKIRLDIASVGHGIERSRSRGRHRRRERDGPQIAEKLKFDHAANMPFSDRGTGISFLARDGICALEQRARAGARHRHHARQTSDERSRDRRRGARRDGHDRRLPGERRHPISGSAAPLSPTPAASCCAMPRARRRQPELRLPRRSMGG